MRNTAERDCTTCGDCAFLVAGRTRAVSLPPRLITRNGSARRYVDGRATWKALTEVRFSGPAAILPRGLSSEPRVLTIGDIATHAMRMTKREARASVVRSCVRDNDRKHDARSHNGALGAFRRHPSFLTSIEKIRSRSLPPPWRSQHESRRTKAEAAQITTTRQVEREKPNERDAVIFGR